jgi:hypothetical protein
LFCNVRTLPALVVFTAWLPNASDEADKVVGAVPVPLNCAVCGEFEALSLTVSVPVRAPRAVGVEVTEIVQLSFAANVFGDKGQFEVCAKSPEVEIPAMVRGTVWVLLRTTALAVLVVCTTQFPKETLVGLRV